MPSSSNTPPPPLPSLVANPAFGRNRNPDIISCDAVPVLDLLKQCPAYQPTEMLDATDLAAEFGVGRLWLKDESTRMRLGSFKALGAAYVVARMARDAQEKHAKTGEDATYNTALKGITLLAASAGNHGLSLAAAARLFGAKAVIYLSQSVPQSFAARLEGLGAEVIRSGTIYEDSMAQAQADAQAGRGMLISDSSWPGYHEIPYQIMQGYLVMGCEITHHLDEEDQVPTHIFLQAGVGGLAASLARWLRRHYGPNPIIITVEPDQARPIQASLIQEKLVSVSGDGSPPSPPSTPSCMGRLDCLQASELAFKALADDANYASTITEAQALKTTQLLKAKAYPASPSGTAAVSALQHLSPNDRKRIGLTPKSCVLAILSEGTASEKNES